MKATIVTGWRRQIEPLGCVQAVVQLEEEADDTHPDVVRESAPMTTPPSNWTAMIEVYEQARIREISRGPVVTTEMSS